MTGIELYKSILEGDSKYEGKMFNSNLGKIKVEQESIFKNGLNILFNHGNELHEFFKGDVTEGIESLPWYACIKRWADNPDKYYIEVFVKSHLLEFNGVYHLMDMKILNIDPILITQGVWYLKEV